MKKLFNFFGKTGENKTKIKTYSNNSQLERGKLFTSLKEEISGLKKEPNTSAREIFKVLSESFTGEKELPEIIKNKLHNASLIKVVNMPVK